MAIFVLIHTFFPKPIGGAQSFTCYSKRRIKLPELLDYFILIWIEAFSIDAFARAAPLMTMKIPKTKPEYVYELLINQFIRFSFGQQMEALLVR